MVSLTDLHLRAVRARIASAVVHPPMPAQLGSIVLRDDQRASAARVRAAIARHGGCLLADDVGRGKTYVALAVARGWSRPAVVLPAALRSTWTDAMRRARVECEMITHEALSRGRVLHAVHDGIIVDESHRFRSTNARRYETLARSSSRSQLLLLSATPVQNRLRDLAAQVALFHGERAFHLEAGPLAEFVVRSDDATGVGLPRVAPPIWVRPTVDDGAVLERLISLPSPPRSADGGDAGVLRTVGLVRAWASSRAALVATLRRRRRTRVAIEQSAQEGLVPTTCEIRSWAGGDDAVQLGFPSVLVRASADAIAASCALHAVSYEDAATTLLDRAIASSADPDVARVQALRDIRGAHAGERVLAFSERASTIRAFFASMRSDVGVGMLTAREARIASGRITRDELLARFAPSARGAHAPVERERVTLLLSTDLLSEGVNLQDASVVVHLDLPWNPARLAQRVGRIRRPGGAATVCAYLLAPPAPSELLLDVERRLRRKLHEAERTIGRSLDVMPALTTLPDDARSDGGRAAALGELSERVRAWSQPFVAPRFGPADRALVAGVVSAVGGWVAVLDDGTLVASLDEEEGDAMLAVTRAVRLSGGARRPLSSRERGARLAECQARIALRRLLRECGRASGSSELQAAADRCIARAMERSARHARAATARLGKQLRDALDLPRPLGAEQALRAMLGSSDATVDAEWLIAAAELACATPARVRSRDDSHIVAMLVLGPGPHMNDNGGPSAAIAFNPAAPPDIT